MVTKRGRLLNNENFTGMIENLGDAYEAAEECYGMIWVLASMVAAGPAAVGAQPSRDQLLEIISLAEAQYQQGLRLGGVQRSR